MGADREPDGLEPVMSRFEKTEPIWAWRWGVRRVVTGLFAAVMSFARYKV
jgi:hypothetical protein